MNNSESIKEAETSIYKTLLIGVGIGAVGIIGYPYAADISIKAAYISLLVALGSFVCGFFTGMLFGMPKRNNDVKSDYTLNNSLVEISDWLTKIIVGLGLINLKEIPVLLKNAGDEIASSIGNTGDKSGCNTYMTLIILYYGVFGLYIGYNFMRLVLSQKYKDADNNLLEENEVLKEQAKMLVEKINEEKPTEKEVNYSAIKDQLRVRANGKYQNGLIENQGKDDPQKHQWGKTNVSNNRKLTANVKEMMKGLFQIDLSIISTDPVNHPLIPEDVILVALHPTFGNPPFRYLTVENGEAKLRLITYGSFTVGAFTDNGATELELDLAELPGVSTYFKEH